MGNMKVFTLDEAIMLLEVVKEGFSHKKDELRVNIEAIDTLDEQIDYIFTEISKYMEQHQFTFLEDDDYEEVSDQIEFNQEIFDLFNDDMFYEVKNTPHEAYEISLEELLGGTEYKYPRKASELIVSQIESLYEVYHSNKEEYVKLYTENIRFTTDEEQQIKAVIMNNKRPQEYLLMVMAQELQIDYETLSEVSEWS